MNVLRAVPLAGAPSRCTPHPVQRELEFVVRRAEQLLSEHSYADVLALLGEFSTPAVSAPALAVRMLFCTGWSHMYLGDLDAASAALERARSLTEGALFTDTDRAEALFRLGCCRFLLGKVSNSVSILSTAFTLSDRPDVECHRLRSRILDWRSRAYQLQREWEAAAVDAERSLELAELAGDDRLAGLALMQCSLVAERRGETWVARYYGERARVLAHEAGDVQTEARILNNLGGLSFLLDQPDRAVEYLKSAFALSLEVGNRADAAQAVSSLAQVHLRCGAPLLAEEQARVALAMLEDRDDYLGERGNAQLVLGRALLDQDRDEDALQAFADAEAMFERLGSSSHVAAAWVAQGDAVAKAGDMESAAGFYRRAAEALQDFHF